MFTKSFWIGDSGVLVRAIRTWAQTAVATVGVGTTNLFSADLKNVLAVSTSAAIISILMSLDRSADVKAAVKTVERADFDAGQASYGADCGVGTVR